LDSSHFSLVGALDQAVIATDLSGRITHWNDAATALYGWPADDVIGENILEVTPSTIARAQAEAIMRALAAGTVWSGEFEVRRRDGNVFLASVTDVPVIAEGQMKGIVGLSAPSRTPSDVVSIVKRFVAAADRAWPGRISASIDVDKAMSPASEPHLMQLLALLLLHQEDTLREGAPLEVRVAPPKPSPFSDFGLFSGRPSVYVRVGLQKRRVVNSVLRESNESVEPAKYVPALVRIVGGTLIRAAVPDGFTAWHLLLPSAAPAAS